jgi:O-antigen ligase
MALLLSRDKTRVGQRAPDIARRACWALVAVTGALFLQPLLTQPHGPLMAFGMAGLGIAAAVRPFPALLVVAGLGPLATAIVGRFGTLAGSITPAEMMTLTLLTGWAVGLAIRSRPLDASGTLKWSVAVLIAITMASGIVHEFTAQAQVLAGVERGPGDRVIDYVRQIPDSKALRAASLFAQGLLLILFAGDISGHKPHNRVAVLHLMVYGAAGAAFLTLWRILERAIASDHPWQAFAWLLAHIRLSPHHADLNAAGSYYAMLLLVACGLATARRWLFAGAALIAAALWISGSRVALAAAVLVAIAGGILVVLRRGRRAVRPVVFALAITAVVATAIWSAYPTSRNAAASTAWSIRVMLARAGLQMASDHPVFGVGPGRFYAESADYAGEELWRQGRFTHENAHNNFIQVLAELGIPALILLILILAIVLREAWRSSATDPTPSFAIMSGLIAHLLTWLGGHPLLVPEAAYPFWICAGLATAPVAVSYGAAHAWGRGVGVAALVVLAATLPWRVLAAVRTVPMDHVSAGFSTWHFDEQGARYRIAGGHSTFFVPTSAGSVRIPLRNGFRERLTVEVLISLDGREADRLLLPADDQWRVKRLVLRQDSSGRKYSRVDVEVRLPGAAAPLDVPLGEGGVVMVGRPHIEGS